MRESVRQPSDAMTGFCTSCLAETWEFDPGPIPRTWDLEWQSSGRYCSECHSEVRTLKHTIHGLPLPGGDQYRVIDRGGGDLLVRALLPAGYHETMVSRCPRCQLPFYNAMARECPDCRVPLMLVSQPL